MEEYNWAVRNPEAFSISVGQKVHLDNGVQVEAWFLRPRRLTPGDTAEHEAKHAVVAEKNGTSVETVTIIPGPGYYGLTRLARPDPVAAAAAHADGHSGTSHDVFIIGLMGAGVGSAMGAAAGILGTSREEVEEVAARLEDKKSMGGHEVREAMADAKKGKEVVVFMRSPDGKRKTINKRSHGNAPIKVEKEDLDLLPEAA